MYELENADLAANRDRCSILSATMGARRVEDTGIRTGLSIPLPPQRQQRS